MSIPFVIDNEQHRMADALWELLTQSADRTSTAFFTAWQG